MVVELSRTDARRIAVRAQLLDDHRPDDLVETVAGLGFVQLEPTAAVAPTADLVLWSRLGAAYRPEHLTTALETDGTLFELDLLVRPMADLPFFLAEMERFPERETTARWLDDNEEFVADVLERLELDGPLTARDIPDTSIVAWPSSGWNNDRNVMMLLQFLMLQGRVAVAGRRGRDRLWDLAERVYHADTPTVPYEEAVIRRNERRLQAHGIVLDRTPNLPIETPRVGSAGVPAVVKGVRGTWRLDPAALDRSFAPRTALLSPFDGLIRDRKRMAELFEFDYALEMYKPAAKRRWGYYALPVLHGDRLIGKVDAATDRDRGMLVLHALHEDEPFSPEVRRAVRDELDALATWLGLRLKAPPSARN